MDAAVRGKFAYVITLWGATREYLLGALVLGHSIRRTKTPHQLVCLHTEDVPLPALTLLNKVWDCRLVDHVEAVTSLGWGDQQDARFEKVFTKLRGLGLIEFEKILMMDIDLLVMGNIDNLFQLPAPAALRRGMNERGRWQYKHGDPMDGRSFFSGAMPGKNHSWGQGTGINAGVMLWRPSLEVLDHMLQELVEPAHPEHCRGNGPEQDYLSRYWADAPWTNLGVEYNFQLHHMFNALHPNYIGTSERLRFIENPSLIKVVHFSGESAAKPWHRVLDPKFEHLWPNRTHDEAYAKEFSGEFHGYWLWIERDKSAWDKAAESRRWGGPLSTFFRGEDGLLYNVDEAKGGDGVEGASNASGEGSTLVQLPEATINGVTRGLRVCLTAWFDAFEGTERALGVDLLAALSAALPEAAAPSNGNKNKAEPWKKHWFAKPFMQLPTPARVSAEGGAEAPQPSTLAKVHWHRFGSGWMHEQCKRLASGGPVETSQKASVVCGGSGTRPFVVFNWGNGSCDPFFATDGEEVQGVFVKILGLASRSFSLQDGDLSPLQIWVDGVTAGSVMLLAIVGLEDSLLSDALAVLSTLGLPSGPVPSHCQVFSAAGLACCGASWDATHASCDTAYASIMLPGD